MPKLSVFEQISLDGYFVGPDNDMSWAHRGSEDPEWQEFVSGNASGGGVLLFGRVTYDMMASYWPTQEALRQMPVVAKGMNERTKYVVSSSMTSAAWANTTVIRGNLEQEIRRMKSEPGPDIVILGSGSVVAQLAEAGLVDSYQLVINPLSLGSGRTIFDGTTHPIDMKLAESRVFHNGKVVLTYLSI